MMWLNERASSFAARFAVMERLRCVSRPNRSSSPPELSRRASPTADKAASDGFWTVLGWFAITLPRCRTALHSAARPKREDIDIRDGRLSPSRLDRPLYLGPCPLTHSAKWLFASGFYSTPPS